MSCLISKQQISKTCIYHDVFNLKSEKKYNLSQEPKIINLEKKMYYYYNIHVEIIVLKKREIYINLLQLRIARSAEAELESHYNTAYIVGTPPDILCKFILCHRRARAINCFSCISSYEIEISKKICHRIYMH